MDMDPHYFLDLANRLAKGNEQACWRSAASRAYYAAFHVAEAMLHENDLELTTGAKAHTELRHCLNYSGDEHLEQAATELNTLYAARRHADYELRKHFEPKRAKLTCGIAEKVFDDISSSAVNDTDGSEGVVQRMRSYLDLIQRGRPLPP